MDLEIIHDNDLSKGKVVIQSHKHTEQLPEIIAYIKQLSQNKLFPGKYDDDVYYIKLQDIISFRIENKILTIITPDRQYTSAQRLYEVKSQISPQFLQISKSEIININYIDHLKLNKNGTIEIRFTNNDFTYSSRRYLPLIKEALKL
ncbi:MULTISPECIES: LytTR family DNA-binding domain-containing protein [Staphylococcus]|jgi:DNA-binding LytR/AlgR family response regulator|uniref:LytTR family transcriptional regulator n=2 Tax=Staphylococcus shinii TaxID=2912228 RepID=A0A418IJ09_9STAP|nr:LytTR family DNA-binding domain-containing protein [Staphylococcus shinii]MBO3064813.1 LytTR family transcriptional regulator [Staphylococcus shinii]MDW8563731.1 LytTR family DNA-binding domain-containing protein [Staphylococcus shinii]MDW8566971.1 LytTR family DNA-binding domain-containing protein [Staphylococcus shinii]MDW8569907.1 LytTR family DNA-binding domain-containing protein [Staphylococcus shinii]MDW8574189.1 LytTR family DNA-binding domain-containing protein [Staphylococcus shini